jgi:hypothetical protein
MMTRATLEVSAAKHSVDVMHRIFSQVLMLALQCCVPAQRRAVKCSGQSIALMYCYHTQASVLRAPN